MAITRPTSLTILLTLGDAAASPQSSDSLSDESPYIGFYVFHGDRWGNAIVNKVEDILFKTSFENIRDLSLSLSLSPSPYPYVIIPCTYHPSVAESFVLELIIAKEDEEAVAFIEASPEVCFDEVEMEEGEEEEDVEGAEQGEAEQGAGGNGDEAIQPGDVAPPPQSAECVSECIDSLSPLPNVVPPKSEEVKESEQNDSLKSLEGHEDPLLPSEPIVHVVPSPPPPPSIPPPPPLMASVPSAPPPPSSSLLISAPKQSASKHVDRSSVLESIKSGGVTLKKSTALRSPQKPLKSAASSLSLFDQIRQGICLKVTKLNVYTAPISTNDFFF